MGKKKAKSTEVTALPGVEAEPEITVTTLGQTVIEAPITVEPVILTTEAPISIEEGLLGSTPVVTPDAKPEPISETEVSRLMSDTYTQPVAIMGPAVEPVASVEIAIKEEPIPQNTTASTVVDFPARPRTRAELLARREANHAAKAAVVEAVEATAAEVAPAAPVVVNEGPWTELKMTEGAWRQQQRREMLNSGKIKK